MIKLIKPNKYETGFMHCRREEFLLDSADDINLLPKDCVVGSIAYLADMSASYRLSPSKEWKMVEESSPLSEGAPYQQLVTDAEGVAKWEDRHGYKKCNVTHVIPEMTCGEFYPYNENSVVAVIPGDESNNLHSGTTYTVMWDGVEYSDIKPSYGALDFPGLGDRELAEYPFHIFYTEFKAYGFPKDHIVVTTNDMTATSHTFSVSIVEEEVIPIPAEYLPSTVGIRLNFLKQDSYILGPKFAEAEEVVRGGYAVGMLQITKMDVASQTLNIEWHEAHSIVCVLSMMTQETMHLRFCFTLPNGTNVVYQLNSDDTITEVTA